MYFVVANLAEIDPMYQYSLKYFTQVWSSLNSPSFLGGVGEGVHSDALFGFWNQHTTDDIPSLLVMSGLQLLQGEHI